MKFRDAKKIEIYSKLSWAIYLNSQWLYKIVRLLDVHCELSLLHWAETDFWKNTFHGLLLFLNSFVSIYLRIYISDK